MAKISIQCGEKMAQVFERLIEHQVKLGRKPAAALDQLSSRCRHIINTCANYRELKQPIDVDDLDLVELAALAMYAATLCEGSNGRKVKAMRALIREGSKLFEDAEGPVEAHLYNSKSVEAA